MPAHTDIVTHGWVARLPRGWLPYILLARLDRPIGTWLLFLPGLWGILLSGPSPAEAVRLIVLFGVGSLVMRAAGCVVNDLWDRDIDRRVARTAGRPLASGALRPRQALVFLAALRPSAWSFCCSSTGWRGRWARRRWCWWRCIRWQSG